VNPTDVLAAVYAVTTALAVALILLACSLGVALG